VEGGTLFNDVAMIRASTMAGRPAQPALGVFTEPSRPMGATTGRTGFGCRFIVAMR
jgi:hypothetical protein